MEKEITKEQDAGVGLAEQTETSLGENYLGDTETVDKILRLFANDCIQWRMERAPEEAEQHEIDECKQLALVFLGQNRDFAAMPGWNTAGLIDKFIAPRINTTETEPEMVMASMFVDYLLDVYKLIQYVAEAGTIDEQWQFQSTGIVQHYTELLLGIVTPEPEQVLPDTANS